MSRLDCRQVRPLVAAYHDGELPMDVRVRVQAHLRTCRGCLAERQRLSDVAQLLRRAAALRPPDDGGRLERHVLARLQADRVTSWTGRFNRMFEDMHLVWAAAGATAATMIIVTAVVAVMALALREHPSSMAWIIDGLASPGSNRNPVSVDGRMLLPRSEPGGLLPTPLGTNEVRPVDLRVVAAAKVDLGDPAQRGDFREDLYYRLNVVSLAIPPLRERRDDVPLLFGYFAERAAKRFGRDLPQLTAAASRHLREHDWPGNVRELSHFAERVVLGMEPDDGHDAGPVTVAADALPLPERLERLEAEIIRETLRLHGGDVQQSLAALGVPRKTFYDKLQRHGIVRSDYAGKKG